jgi:hypothetical protein
MRCEAHSVEGVVEAPAGSSRLLQRLYRDIGLAAVAIELELLEEDDLGEDLEDAIERGARYLAPFTYALAS